MSFRINSRRLRAFVSLLALAIVAVGLTTALALESGGVVVATTQASGEMQPRQTRIWFVREGSQVFLEAGHPENPWVRDLEAGSALHLANAGFEGRWAYVLHREGRHEEIRRLMRNKYGWRDWWVSVLFDTTQSYPVEVTPLGAEHTP